MSVAQGFSDLTKTGVPDRLPSLLTDEQLYTFSKERFNFYQQLLDELSNPNSVIATRVFGIANRNRYMVEKLRDDMTSLTNAIAILESDKTTPDTKTKLIETLNSQIKGNMFLKDLTFGQIGAPAGTSGSVVPKVGGGTIFEDLTTLKAIKDSETFKRFSIRYENDPIMAPSNDEVTSTDRVIFIAITFLFRGISLFLTEWALNSYMFNGFQSAIGWYCMVYLSLFLLLTFLVNATTDIQVFRMTFYYLSFTPNGVGRTLLHCIVLLMLIPIPFLVKEKIPGMEDESEEDSSFTKRRAIMRVLSNLTFFIWILTAAIALRY